MSQRLPFPPPGSTFAQEYAGQPPSREGSDARDLWRTIRTDLGMTLVGAIGLATVVVLGSLATIVLVGADVFSDSEHGDQAGAVLFIFGLIAVGAVSLVVLAADGLFRVIRAGVRAGRRRP